VSLRSKADCAAIVCLFPAASRYRNRGERQDDRIYRIQPGWPCSGLSFLNSVHPVHLRDLRAHAFSCCHQQWQRDAARSRRRAAGAALRGPSPAAGSPGVPPGIPKTRLCQRPPKCPKDREMRACVGPGPSCMFNPHYVEVDRRPHPRQDGRLAPWLACRANGAGGPQRQHRLSKES
jgi:hypothetical protein